MDDEDLISHLLTGEGIRNYPQDLRQLSAAELRRLFAFASSGKMNATRVIKNLIWQAYTAIRDGRRAPIAGNLRSFWYTDVITCALRDRINPTALSTQPACQGMKFTPLNLTVSSSRMPTS